MEFSAKDIAGQINGEILGNPDVKVSSVATIENAQEGDLSHLSNAKYYHFLYTTKASLVIANKDMKVEGKVNPTIIFVDDAYSALTKLLELYNTNQNDKTGIEQPCFISESAKIGNDVYIGAFAYIGENVQIGNGTKIYPQTYIGDNSIIGDQTVIYSGVKIYFDTQIGDNCILHSGCVIGSDGFGFSKQENGTYVKVPQIGKVIINDNVEIGANTTIDRATIQSTILEDGVKLDNLIHIAHNVEIGKNTAIAAQTGASGSTKIGENCVIGGQVGFAGHLSVAEGVQIAAQSGVPSSIKEKNSIWFGSSVQPYKQHLKYLVSRKHLPNLVKKIRELEKEIEKIQK